MKNKIKIVYVIIRIVRDGNGEFGFKQTDPIKKVEGVTTKRVKPSKMVTIQVPDYYHELVMARPVRSDILT